MAAACLVAILINMAVTLKIQEENAIASRSMTTSGNILSTATLNGMSMIDTIKSQGAEQAFFKMWKASQHQANEGKLRSQRVNSMISFVSGIHGYLLQGIQLFMGAYFVLHGNFTLGSMALFQGILNNMITSMNNCLTAVNSLQTMRTNIERVNDIMCRTSRQPIPIPKSEYDKVDKLQGQLIVRHPLGIMYEERSSVIEAARSRSEYLLAFRQDGKAVVLMPTMTGYHYYCPHDSGRDLLQKPILQLCSPHAMRSAVLSKPKKHCFKLSWFISLVR